MRILAVSGKWSLGECFSTVILTTLLVCPGQAYADASSQGRYAIEQPAQSLADSLRAIARQTGASVLFDPGAVSGRQARAVSGRLTAAEAVARAVDGTGLVVELMKDGSIVVRAPDAGSSKASVSRPPPLTSDGADPAVPFAGVGEPHLMSKIEITGSRLKRIEAEGPLPVNVYRREDIDKSGQPTLSRFLSSLNESAASPGEGGINGNSGQGSVQLRGLPLGSTLVLLNGRRLQAVGSSSANFFNLNLIPIAAVDRIEVVPVGSSAVYGGDALAGVVNIILKKAIDGTSLDARIAHCKGFEDGSISLATGSRSESGAFLLLGAVSKATPLSMSERGFFKDADYRRFGGIDARSTTCAPGTVTSTNAANLPGLNSTNAGIPVNSAGQSLTTASFAATAGRPNLCNDLAIGNGYALAFGKESIAVHAVADQIVNASWSVFGEMTYSDDRLGAKQDGLTLANVLVPAANLYNPFGVPVRVTTSLAQENGVRGFALNTRFARALGGVRGDLSAGWELEATASTSRDNGEQVRTNATVNAAARTSALASQAQPNSLNPFATGRAASDDVLKSIWSDQVRKNVGRKDQLSAFVRGPVVVLPAGSVDAIVGGEWAQDRYETSIAGSVNINEGRVLHAIYGEMRAPLLKGDSPVDRGGDLAAITIAGRRDGYSDFGSAGTYQAGLEIRPTRSLLVRGSVATSFKPPTLLQVNVDDISLTTEAFGLVDPLRGNAPVLGGEILRTTNHSLKPEEGRAFSLGAAWESEAGSRLGLTAWKVKVNGLIGLLTPQSTLNNELLFPRFVIRGPTVSGVPGPVTQLLYAETNIGRVETAGMDLEASHNWQAAAGKWTAAASATKVSRYEVMLAPGSSPEDRLGRRYGDYWAPEWKARISVGLDSRKWSLGITGRYLGGYKDAGSSQRNLGNYMLVDLAGRLDLKKLGASMEAFKAATVSFGVVNLANRLPEFVETSPYYDVTQADWRGRTASVRMSIDW